jgi:hypothetical protein
MAYMPTLYKARRVPTKQPVCAICVDRTRGRTQLVSLGYGTHVWLCAGHASDGFQRQRSGRDFVLTLHQLWHAHGCLTVKRSRALDAHLERMRARPPARPLPGSYAWPHLRQEAERRYAQGAPAPAVAREIAGAGCCARCRARPPTLRTFQRWHADRRWLEQLPG